MDKALLFKNDNDMVVVSAQEVFDGKYDRNSNFTDLEYNYRVTYVKKAKGVNGKPYFRIYLAHDEYLITQGKKTTKQEIIQNMRHFKECEWHRNWKELFSSFCGKENIEKYIKNSSINKYKLADAYNKKTNTVFEFQHSYIDFDFDDKNSFYRSLNINIIWLYDVSDLEIKQIDDNTFHILEDNSKGFFKVSEVPINLEDNFIYIQGVDKKIYRVKKLLRKRLNIESDKKATIREFNTSEIYTIDEFLKYCENNYFLIKEPKSLNDYYDSNLPDFFAVFLEGIAKSERQIIKVSKRSDGFLRDKQNGNIKYWYGYFDEKLNNYQTKSIKYYHLSKEDAKNKSWIFLASYPPKAIKFK